MTIKSTPYWQDACGHKSEEYIGSAEYMECEELNKIDVYLYQCPTYKLGVCIRCSNEPEDYISPGSLVDFLGIAYGKYSGVYAKAYKILTSMLDITATKKNDS